jgi:hypothetical protein
MTALADLDKKLWKELKKDAIQKLQKLAGPNLEKLDQIEAQKRIEVWNKSKLPWKF